MTADASRGTDALVGTILAERYRIEELIGKGGMGTVYRAEHVGMRKQVAFKVLDRDPTGVDESAARFEREAIAAARVDHARVAKAMDFGHLPDGSPYLVIEYVSGESLSTLVQRGPLAPERALAIVRQVAEALEAAHKVGVVHRDLKPANVMIGDDGSVKVLDFGVAKLLTDAPSGGPAITRFGEIIGTFEYMAPEQAGGSKIDHRVDLYALGVILYELLAGHPPFCGADGLEIVAKHFSELPPPLPGTVPEKTRSLVLDLLAKEPDARVQTAAALIERIDAARGELPPASDAPLADTIAAPAASAAEPHAHAHRRPRRRVALLAVSALALMIAASAVIARSVASGEDKPGRVARVPLEAVMTIEKLAPSDRPGATDADEPSAPPAAGDAPAAKATANATGVRTTKHPVQRVQTSSLPKGTRIIIRRRVVRRTTTR